MSQNAPGLDQREMRLAKMMETIRAADAQGDIDRGISTRLKYMEFAEFSGRYDEALVNFTWCVGVCDKDPELREKYSFKLLWRFKWVILSLVKYHQVTRAQLDHTYAQMRRWYDRAGKSHRAIHMLQMSSILHTGETDALDRQRDLWLKSPEDDTKDCTACEASTLMESYLWENRLHKAVEVSHDLVAGRVRCAEQPQLAHMILLVPLFRLGEFDLARHLVRQSHASIIGNRECMTAMGQLTVFLTATDYLGVALEVVQSILHELPMVRRGWDRMASLMGVRLFLMRLLAIGRNSIQLRLLPGNPLKADGDSYAVQPLLDWSNAEITRLAAAFDARNANTYVSTLARQDDDLLDQIRPYPPSPAANDLP